KETRRKCRGRHSRWRRLDQTPMIHRHHEGDGSTAARLATKEEVRRWDAQERKSTLKRSASLPNWGSPKRTLPSMWVVVKRRSAGVLLRFTNSVSRNAESLSEGSCGSMREQATPR